MALTADGVGDEQQERHETQRRRRRAPGDDDLLLQGFGQDHPDLSAGFLGEGHDVEGHPRHQLAEPGSGLGREPQAILPALREQRSETIITTTSIGGLVTFPFNAVYHATKWALEGWSESLAFELEPFGIRVRTVAPGGMATDFSSRSLVVTLHPAYAEAIGKTMAAFSSPDRRSMSSTAEQVAEVVYEAATDETDRVTFVAGADAKANYAQRLAVGIDAFRAGIRSMFLGG